MVYSFSRIKVFETCKKQFKYQYIDKIPAEVSPIALSGSRIHTAIELKNPSNLKHLEELTMYDNSFKWLDSINVTEMEKKLAIDSKGNPVDFDSKEAIFRGIIDVLYNKEGVINGIIDWKTGYKEPDIRQLYCYSMLAKANDISVDELRFIMLRFDRVIEVPTIDIALTLEWLENTIINIESEKEYTYTIGNHCSWCAYKKQCLEFVESQEYTDTNLTLDKLILYNSYTKQLIERLKEHIERTGDNVHSKDFSFERSVTKSLRCKSKPILMEQLIERNILSEYATIDSSMYQNLIENYPELKEFFSESLRTSFSLKDK
jgi:hypothetical protein